MRSEINFIRKERIQKISKNGLSPRLSFTPGAAPGHFWKVQRESDRPCESAFEPRSVRGIPIRREKAGAGKRRRRRRRTRRRSGRKRAKKVEANKNLTSGPLCEGNHSKRDRDEKRLFRYRKGAMKNVLWGGKETKMENACRGFADKFPDGKTKCADRAGALTTTFRFHFAEKYTIRQIASP